MAYTIQLVFDKFLDKVDKEGSDIISVVQVMELLETEAYSFLEENFKYIENNQQIRDAILPLSKSFNIDLVLNQANNKELIGSLPSDYLYLETIDIFVPGVSVREVRVIRRGELDRNKNNPNAKPTDQYPKVIEYANTFGVYGPTVFQGVKASGFYLSKPVLGNHTGDLDQEIAINLPDNTVEKLLVMMVANYKERTGDPGFQAAYIQKQSYGNSK